VTKRFLYSIIYVNFFAGVVTGLSLAVVIGALL
jgi:cytochrome bd-type quinol oxidase subunit 1